MPYVLRDIIEMLTLERFSAKLYEKIVKCQKLEFGTKNVFVEQISEFYWNFISTGSVLVLYIHFHADLFSNFAIPTFFGTPCIYQNS